MPSLTQIRRFVIEGLLGQPRISLSFPDPLLRKNEPAVLILSGRNGVGKTTILRMIEGMLNLNFDEFRRIPFKVASLTLSTGDILVVTSTNDEKRPLLVTFRQIAAVLSASRDDQNYSRAEEDAVARFRAEARPILRGIQYDLVEPDRVRDNPESGRMGVDAAGRTARFSSDKPHRTLAFRVREFLRDAQIDHSRFFLSEELGVLPKLLERLREGAVAPSQGELVERLDFIASQLPAAVNLGINVNSKEVSTLRSLLLHGPYQEPQHLALIETYVENQELFQNARNLLVDRLVTFEKTLNSFFIGKEVSVDREHGLIIRSGKLTLNEFQLSSGERHFLSMMVVALLCQRTGTIIAIDEPELSLHISWQRKLVSALTSCAAGASPLFLFATHSLAIAAEFSDKVHRLSQLD